MDDHFFGHQGGIHWWCAVAFWSKKLLQVVPQFTMLLLASTYILVQFDLISIGYYALYFRTVRHPQNWFSKVQSTKNKIVYVLSALLLLCNCLHLFRKTPGTFRVGHLATKCFTNIRKCLPLQNWNFGHVSAKIVHQRVEEVSNNSYF